MNINQGLHNFGHDVCLLSFAPYDNRNVTLLPAENAQPVNFDARATCPISLDPLANINQVVRLNCVEGKPPHDFSYTEFKDPNHNKTRCDLCKTPIEPRMVTVLVKQGVNHLPVNRVVAEIRPEVRRLLDSPLKQKAFAIFNGAHWISYGAMACLSNLAIISVGTVILSSFAITRFSLITLASPIIMLGLINGVNEEFINKVYVVACEISLVVAALFTYFIGIFAVCSALMISPVSGTAAVIQGLVIAMTAAGLLTEYLNIPKPVLTPRAIWNNDLETTREIAFCSYDNDEGRGICEEYTRTRVEASALTQDERIRLISNDPVNNAERTRLGIDPHGELNANDFVTRENTAFATHVKWDLP